MNIRIVRVDTSGIEKHLERIADALEGILGATDPIPATPDDFPGDRDTERVFYNDDGQEIIDYHLQRLGKLRK